MKVAHFLICLSLLIQESLYSENTEIPREKIVIIGGGIIGAIEAYYTYLDVRSGEAPIQIVIYEKGPSFERGARSNTAYHICPSLTPDEILSVVPRGPELLEKLALLFSEPGGIRIDDVPNLNDSLSANLFKAAIQRYSHDPNHEDRCQSLLMLGKMSMDLWRSLYDQASPELKKIFDESNFHPCSEPKDPSHLALGQGYRIDLLYGIANVQNRAEEMISNYKMLGYSQCKALSPEEAMSLDTSLVDFCEEHSLYTPEGDLVWEEGTLALWRPGGCLSTKDFLPAFYAYLKKIMGNHFSLEFDKEVTGIAIDDELQITGLYFKDGSFKANDPIHCHYVFCPGESVGTLRNLGFHEPPYAAFAGPSLTLTLPSFATPFTHCMEVHKVGVVLAWQARAKDHQFILQVGGTKAFYGDQTPTIDEAFATDRHLLQLNIMNEVLPEMISLAIGKETKNQPLSLEDLYQLEEQGILSRWVGRRAVAYDGFPTLGALFVNEKPVKNARCTTHMGSGGVSFAPAVVKISRSFQQTDDPFTLKILNYANSKRM